MTGEARRYLIGKENYTAVGGDEEKTLWYSAGSDEPVEVLAGCDLGFGDWYPLYFREDMKCRAKMCMIAAKSLACGRCTKRTNCRIVDSEMSVLLELNGGEACGSIPKGYAINMDRAREACGKMRVEQDGDIPDADQDWENSHGPVDENIFRF